MVSEVLLNGREVHNIEYKREEKGNVAVNDDDKVLGLKGEIRSGERTSLKRNKIKAYTMETDDPICILHSFQIEGIGTVGEGSAKRIQRGAMATPGLDVGRPDMGDLRVLR
jgi:hypothetical protein